MKGYAMSNNLYMYTFPSYYYEVDDNLVVIKDENGNSVKKTNPRIKIGDSTRDIETRIMEQMGTSNGEECIILKSWEDFPVRDYKVHSELEALDDVFRIRDAHGKEWFQGPEDDIIKCINSVKYGAFRINNYSMREEQWGAVEKTMDYFDSGGVEFLWNAKMRFGKTFASYELMAISNFKKVLIITYKTDVRNNWKNELLDHVDFDRYKFIDSCDYSSSNIIEKLDDYTVVFSSFQDMHLSDDDVKAKFINISNEEFDLIILDEVHYGAGTDKAKSVLEYLNYERVLHLSGTPIKLLNSNKFGEDQIFNWTYMDESKFKKEEIDRLGVEEAFKNGEYFWLPSINFFIYNIDDEAIEKCNNLDEGFAVSDFFKVAEGEFVNYQFVKSFIDKMVDKDDNTSPFFNNLVKSPLDHGLWILPGVAECVAMANILEGIPYFKSTKIICAVGTVYNSGSEALTDVLKSIKEANHGYSEYKRTVTLTCGMLTTGVTVPDWNYVLFLDNTTSAEKYFQAAFRAQSSNRRVGKEECYVFDYNPIRTLKVVYDYASINSDTSSGKRRAVEEFLRTINIMSYDNNEVVKIEASDILDVGMFSITPSVTAGRFINSRALAPAYKIAELLLSDNQELVLIFDALNGNIKRRSNYSNKSKVVNITSNNIKTKSRTTKSSKSREDNPEEPKYNSIEKSKMAKRYESIRRFVETLPSILYLSSAREGSFVDFVDRVDYSMLEDMTMVNKDMILKMIEFGFFNPNYISDSIEGFKNIEFSIIEKESL